MATPSIGPGIDAPGGWFVGSVNTSSLVLGTGRAVTVNSAARTSTAASPVTVNGVPFQATIDPATGAITATTLDTQAGVPFVVNGAPTGAGSPLVGPSLDTTAAGLLTLGGVAATSIQIDRAGWLTVDTHKCFFFVCVGGATVATSGGDGPLIAPSLDTATTVPLMLGGTTASQGEVGKAGACTIIKGALQGRPSRRGVRHCDRRAAVPSTPFAALSAVDTAAPSSPAGDTPTMAISARVASAVPSLAQLRCSCAHSHCGALLRCGADSCPVDAFL
jgi:hypothetical protein